jgi:hypothetical protein
VSTNGTEVTYTGTAYTHVNPLAAKNQSYTPAIDPHFKPRDDYSSDARNGTLPNISWVIPSGQDWDHPGWNSTWAQGGLASVVDAPGASPDRNSSVMYVTWDDYGGFYDHVAPPVFDGTQLSFRVPLLTIGPYALVGHVGHYLGYFESVLHLMEGGSVSDLSNPSTARPRSPSEASTSPSLSTNPSASPPTSPRPPTPSTHDGTPPPASSWGNTTCQSGRSTNPRCPTSTRPRMDVSGRMAVPAGT